jgi:murein DD-endopeptidase MepM/ murein hydrolase activator NlpD
MSRLAEACTASYLDFNVNTATNKVDAWAFVEDYYDNECNYGWGYFFHDYLATVQIVSPTQNYATDGDAQYGVVGGGGSASAFASLSFQGDAGVFDISLEVSIWCSVVGYIHQWPWVGIAEAPRHTYSVWPTDECGISGNDYSSGHPGKDVNASAYGSNVKSMDSGTVEYVYGSGQPNVPGDENFVVVQGSDGMYTIYAHVTPSVSPQDTVTAGDSIGVVDNTGRTNGPHAHICRSENPGCGGGVDYNLPNCP